MNIANPHWHSDAQAQASRVPDPPPEKPDYTQPALGQELMAAVDRAVGLRRELIAQAARIAELERENAELRKESF